MLETAVVCLALNMYHEARGEGISGMVAVGQTTMNRVNANDKRWPNDVCKVVKQRGPHGLSNCQFSWYCERTKEHPQERDKWELSTELSRGIIEGTVGSPELSRATCYHASWVLRRPKWATDETFLRRIGDHLFYAC